MNIYQKMAAITAELGTVAKNLNVKAGMNQTYKAVGERDILDAVKPLEQKFGIYSYPVSRETLESEQLESTTKNGDTRTTFYTRLKTVYRFVNTENPEEFIETTVFSVGMDTQDKGDGKAMTYADKYALMKAYKISTGDDPDQEGSSEEGYKKKGGTTDVYYCSKCKKPVVAYKGKDGKMVYPARHIERSKEVYGKILCIDCIAKMTEEENVDADPASHHDYENESKNG